MGPVARPTKSFAIVMLALCVAALVHWVALDGPFLLDDQHNLGQAVISELSLNGLVDAATGNDSGLLGRPIPAVSFALNSYFGSGDPFGFKAVNLGLHLVNALLVYSFCSLVLSISARERRVGSAARLAAAIATAIWVLHPLQVSTTLYVVQRMVLLMTMFTLSALIAYCIARRNLERGEGVVLPWLAAVPILTLLACFSKENGVLIFLYIPLIELLVFRKPLEPRSWVIGLRRLGIWACAASAAAVVVALSLRFNAFAASYQGRDFDALGRVLAELHVITLYLRQIVFPWITKMPFYYDGLVAPTTLGRPEAVATLLLVSLLTVGMVSARRLPILSFGVGLFFAAHALESTVLPLELAFEHRNYLAMLGIALPVGFGIERTLHRSTFRLAGGIAAATLIGSLAVVTQSRAVVWSDSLLLHEHAVRASPLSERAWIALAIAFAERGDVEAGLAVLARAEEEAGSSSTLALQKLQLIWYRDRNDEELLQKTANALATEPVVADDAILLGAMVDQRLVSENRYPLPAQLRTLYAAAVDNPDRRLGKSNAAMLLAQHQRLLRGAGDVDAALRSIVEASRLDPSNGEIALRLAEAFVRAGRLAEASEPLDRARRSAPRGNRAVHARLERVISAIDKGRQVSID